MQCAWIKYRDVNCVFYVDLEGGTLAVVEGTLCEMTNTTELAQALEDFKQ